MQIGSVWRDNRTGMRVTVSDGPPVLREVHYVTRAGTRHHLPEEVFKSGFTQVLAAPEDDDQPPADQWRDR